MSFPLAVIDTNVIVSGLIAKDPDSPVCRILDLMLAGSLRFALSPALLAEYRSVALRPRIQRLHGLDVTEVERILRKLAVNAIWREPATARCAPDPGDDHLWALLGAGTGLVLVTGDRLLLENPPASGSVLSPRSFLELITVR
ncbi:MAG: putative toxin-antitoxin system toxin component, PIN family [Gammaproteobacteria bacterium]|nr:putative toxin-antitoxin system toxin component, PIN family [Gammaproteobacteria bacterium]